jgi:ribonuclease P protein component
MISRKNRFHGYGSLKFVYRNGVTTRGPLFAVKVVGNPKRAEYRVAVVVSRKVDKSAVRRNRIRRRLYEAVRSLASDIKEPYDIVLSVFSNAVLDEPYARLLKQLKKQLSEAGVLVKTIK